MTMRRSLTAVIEQGNTFTADGATEPYEAGWASEARWFIRLLGSEGNDAELEATPEVSPDGLVWCPCGAAPMTISAATPAPSMVTSVQHGFGNWLRLSLRLRGQSPRMKLLIYLVLKE